MRTGWWLVSLLVVGVWVVVGAAGCVQPEEAGEPVAGTPPDVIAPVGEEGAAGPPGEVGAEGAVTPGAEQGERSASAASGGPPAGTTAPSAGAAPSTASGQGSQRAAAPPAASSQSGTPAARAAPGARPGGAASGQGAGSARGGQAMPPVDPEERRARMFDRMDANHDGKLTRDELPGPGADSMMQADTNGDGAISRQEFDKAAEAMREAFARGPGGGAGFGGPGGGFERMDANGDGVLKGDEIPERFRERWMQGDANGDGALTREELQKLWEARRGQGPSGGGGER